MNTMAHPSLSFEEARRRHLIEATIEAVADVGFKAASLSQIARRANVSTGLYAHYFRDKDGLLEATLRFLAARLATALRSRLKLAPTSRERLLAVVDVALGDQEFDRRTSAVWLAFWGQIAHSDRFQRIQFAYQRRLHTNLRHAFRACVPAERVEHCAIVVAGLIDGLWLQSHAYKGPANAGAARETVHQVVFTLIETAHDRHSDRGARPASRAKHAAETAVARPEATPAGGRVELAPPGAAWTGMRGAERSATLQRCADLVAERAAALARLEADATGRPTLTALEFCIPRCGLAFRQAAAQARAPAVVHHAFDGVTGTEMNGFGGIVRTAAHRSAPLVDMCRAVAGVLGSGGAVVVDVPQAARGIAAALGDLLATAGVPAAAVAFHVADASAASGPASVAWPPGAATPGGWRAESAAIILAEADIERAVDSVLAGRDLSRRTPDLSETLLFVDEAAVPTVEAVAKAWFARAVAAANPTCGSSRGAGLAPGAVDGEPTILRLQASTAVAATNLFAPLLQVIGFATDGDLLAVFAQAAFGSVAIFGGGGRASRLAQAAPAPVCSIDAYEPTEDGLVQDWMARADRLVPPRRLLTFRSADA